MAVNHLRWSIYAQQWIQVVYVKYTKQTASKQTQGEQSMEQKMSITVVSIKLNCKDTFPIHFPYTFPYTGILCVIKDLILGICNIYKRKALW